MTPLVAAREAMGLKRWRVAAALGLDQTGLKKIEVGRCRPMVHNAEALYEFYGGLLPLGMIFHPRHPQYHDWLTPHKERRLRQRARALREQYPEHFV